MKEALDLSTDPAYALEQREPAAFAADDRGFRDWSAVRQALGILDLARLSHRLRVPVSRVLSWLRRDRRPRNIEPRELIAAIGEEIRQSGLRLSLDGDIEDVCRELPRRAAAAQCWVTAASILLVRRAGSVRALAREMGVKHSVVQRMIRLAQQPPQPAAESNALLARLGDHARATGKRPRSYGRNTDHSPQPDRDRMALLLTRLPYPEPIEDWLAPKFAETNNTLVLAPLMLGLLAIVGIVLQCSDKIHETFLEQRKPTVGKVSVGHGKSADQAAEQAPARSPRGYRITKSAARRLAALGLGRDRRSP